MLEVGTGLGLKPIYIQKWTSELFRGPVRYNGLTIQWGNVEIAFKMVIAPVAQCLVE
jgi:hypothetical protein